MNDNAVQEFVNSIKDQQIETDKSYTAIVSRVDGEGTVWVNVAGSDKETPTASSSSEVKTGDVVTVEWRNNKLYIAGNYSNPSAGIARVHDVELSASIAKEAANNAVADANKAREAAEQAEATAIEIESIARTAETNADVAKTAANSALKGLSTVESVVDVLTWISEHGAYALTADVTIVSGKMYYTVVGTAVTNPTVEDIGTYYEMSGDHYVKTSDTAVVSGKTYYTVVGTPVANPDVAQIGTYYELTITKAVSNYIQTHLALTDDGLYVMADESEWKLLVANDGVYIIDDSGTAVARYKAAVTLGTNNGLHVNIDNDSIDFMDGNTTLGYVGTDTTNFSSVSATGRLRLMNKYVFRLTPEGKLGLYLK